MKQVNVLLPKELADDLKRIAIDRGCTRQELLAGWLSELVQRERKKHGKRQQ